MCGGDGALCVNAWGTPTNDGVNYVSIDAQKNHSDFLYSSQANSHVVQWVRNSGDAADPVVDSYSASLTEGAGKIDAIAVRSTDVALLQVANRASSASSLVTHDAACFRWGTSVLTLMPTNTFLNLTTPGYVAASEKMVCAAAFGGGVLCYDTSCEVIAFPALSPAVVTYMWAGRDGVLVSFASTSETWLLAAPASMRKMATGTPSHPLYGTAARPTLSDDGDTESWLVQGVKGTNGTSPAWWICQADGQCNPTSVATGAATAVRAVHGGWVVVTSSNVVQLVSTNAAEARVQTLKWTGSPSMDIANANLRTSEHSTYIIVNDRTVYELNMATSTAAVVSPTVMEPRQISAAHECQTTAWLSPAPTAHACMVHVLNESNCSTLFFNYANMHDNNCGCIKPAEANCSDPTATTSSTASGLYSVTPTTREYAEFSSPTTVVHTVISNTPVQAPELKITVFDDGNHDDWSYPVLMDRENMNHRAHALWTLANDNTSAAFPPFDGGYAMDKYTETFRNNGCVVCSGTDTASCTVARNQSDCTASWTDATCTAQFDSVDKVNCTGTPGIAACERGNGCFQNGQSNTGTWVHGSSHPFDLLSADNTVAQLAALQAPTYPASEPPCITINTDKVTVRIRPLRADTAEAAAPFEFYEYYNTGLWHRVTRTFHGFSYFDKSVVIEPSVISFHPVRHRRDCSEPENLATCVPTLGTCTYAGECCSLQCDHTTGQCAGTTATTTTATRTSTTSTSSTTTTTKDHARRNRILGYVIAGSVFVLMSACALTLINEFGGRGYTSVPEWER